MNVSAISHLQDQQLSVIQLAVYFRLEEIGRVLLYNTAHLLLLEPLKLADICNHLKLLSLLLILLLTLSSLLPQLFDTLLLLLSFRLQLGLSQFDQFLRVIAGFPISKSIMYTLGLCSQGCFYTYLVVFPVSPWYRYTLYRSALLTHIVWIKSVLWWLIRLKYIEREKYKERDESVSFHLIVLHLTDQCSIPGTI